MIRVAAVGRIRAEWARLACDDYARRIQRFGRFEVVEIADSDPPREGKAMLESAGRDHFVCCDPTGTLVSSEDLADLLGRHGAIRFAIGGPDGLSDAVRARADHSIAFGRITLPHELARVVLLEQIYRALSIRAGHPYHR